MKLKALFLTIVLTSTIITHADEVWISPVGSVGTHAGTAADPYVATDAQTFDALIGCVDEYGRTGAHAGSVSPIPANSTIHLMAGTFHTYGMISPKPNWKIRGAGIDVTFVQEEPWNTFQQDTNSFIPVFGFGGWNPGQNDGIEISDLTIDCNVQANTTQGACFEAVNLCAGNDMRVSRVKAINWGSTGQCWSECSIFSIVGGGSTVVTNCVFDDCVVGSPAPVHFSNGADGFVITGIGGYSFGGGWIENAEIRNCVISGIATDLSGQNLGQPQYFSGAGVAKVYGLKVTGNRFVNIAGNGYYSSCDSLINAVIENNLFLDVLHGVYFPGTDACDPNAVPVKENIQVINNFITLKDGGFGIGLSAYQNSRSTNYLVSGNTILPNDSSYAVGGISVANLDQVTLDNNIVNATLGGNGLGIWNINSTIASIGNNHSTAGVNIDLGYEPPVSFNTDLSLSGNASIAGNATIYGNVGIGTDSPLGKLDVFGADAYFRPLPDSTTSFVRIGDTGNDISGVSIYGNDTISGAGNWFIGSDASAPSDKRIRIIAYSTPMVFNVGAVEAMRINQSANVGIGTSSPSQKLSISGNANITGSLAVGGATQNLFVSMSVSGLNSNSLAAEFLSADTQRSMIRFGSPDYSHLMYAGVRKDLAYDSFQFYGFSGVATNPIMVINSNEGLGKGNVGIGTGSPSERLSVSGNASISGTNFASQFVGGGASLTGITPSQVGAAAVSQLPQKFVSGEYTLTNTAYYIWINHGLAATPQMIRWVLVCKTAELGYSVGDEVSAMALVNSGDNTKHESEGANPTSVFVSFSCSGSQKMQLPNKTNPSTPVTLAASNVVSNWKLKCYATYFP